MRLIYLRTGDDVRAGDPFIWPNSKHRLIVGHFEPPRKAGTEGVLTLFLAGQPRLADKFPVSTIGAMWIERDEPGS